MQSCHFKKGDVITKKGDVADSFHVIMTGTVAIRAGTDAQEVFLGSLKRGDLVGDIGFLSYLHIRTADAIASSAVHTFRMDRSEFWDIINKMWLVLSKDLTKWNLPGCVLSIAERKLLTNFVTLKRYPRGYCILKKGQLGKHLYLILTGFVKLDASNASKGALVLGPNTYFGEGSLASTPSMRDDEIEAHQHGQSDDVYVVEDCNILVIKETALNKIPTFSKFVTASLMNASKIKKKSDRVLERTKALKEKIEKNQNFSIEDYATDEQGVTLSPEKQLELDFQAKRSQVVQSDQICANPTELCVVDVLGDPWSLFGLLGHPNTNRRKRSDDVKIRGRGRWTPNLAEEGKSHRPFSK